MLILCGDLARAVRRESETAICHWWGVGVTTVWKWRKVLGVESINEGTSALLSRWAPETVQSDEAARKLADVQGSPERAAKIAAAKHGKPRSETVKTVLWTANLGRKASSEQRRKISESHKARGTRAPAAGVPWAAEGDALIGTMKDGDVAGRTGRTEEAVSARRYSLGVPAFTKRKPRSQPMVWTPAKHRLLGTMSDGNVASRLRCAPTCGFKRRRRLCPD